MRISTLPTFEFSKYAWLVIILLVDNCYKNDDEYEVQAIVLISSGRADEALIRQGDGVEHRTTELPIHDCTMIVHLIVWFSNVFKACNASFWI